MDPRSRPPAGLAAALLAALLGACGGGEDRPRVRHVILITLDTTRADHLGCYGSTSVQTPALDQLAAEGTRFAHCTSAAATTLASHASLFTGLYPHRHGVPRNGFTLDEGNRTLAEVLADEGFWCAGVLGSAALTARTGVDQGFVHWDEDFDEAVEAGGNDQTQRDAAAVTDRLLAHAEEVLGRDGAEDARLFLFAQYFDPHAPYAPPEAQVARYGAAFPVGDFARIEEAVRAQQVRALGHDAGGQQGVISRGLSEELVRGASGLPTDVGRQLARLYAGEVSHMDAQIGRLLLGLGRLGVLEDALVVVTADHGETFWEQGNAWNHGLWVGRTDVEVPLIVRMPAGAVRPGVVRTPVSGVDVMPTVLALLGLEPPAPGLAGGRSLAEALRSGQEPEPVPVFTEATQPGPPLEDDGLPWRNARKPCAVRLGRWKLVRAPYLDLELLYDLEADPEERRDLLTEDAPGAEDRAADLRVTLDRWRAAADPRPSAFDRAQAQGLAGLGYTEVDDRPR